MTWLVVSVSCNIPGILWEKYQQTSFPSFNFLYMSDHFVISAVVYRNLSLVTKRQCSTYILHIAGRWKISATRGHTQQDSSWVSGPSWLLLMPSWHEAKYIVLRTSHFFLLSSSSHIPHQHIMDTQPPKQEESGFKSSWVPGATLHTSVIGTPQECRCLLVHPDAANTATRTNTQDAHLTIVRRTGSSKNKNKHAVGCKYMHVMVKGRRLTVIRTATKLGDPHNQ